jgi:hypothetical protein
MIDSYSFGSIVIDGKKYKKDLIIFPERIKENWLRSRGHLLTEKDIREVLDYRPGIFIIGTGASGLMKVDDSVREKLGSMGIDYLIKKSGDAVDEYNRVCRDKKTVCALHLTC